MLPSIFFNYFTQLYSIIFVKYELTAVVSRPFPFALESMSLSSKILIQVLERINVNDPVFCIRGRAHNDLSIMGLGSSERAELALSLPKYAVVRGKRQKTQHTLQASEIYGKHDLTLML